MIKAAMKAMSMATKVSIRQDPEGVLGMQFMISNPGEGPENTFIDFRFLAQREDEEDEGEEEEDGDNDDEEQAEEVGGGGESYGEFGDEDEDIFI